jgi:hypothetical protein
LACSTRLVHAFTQKLGYFDKIVINNLSSTKKAEKLGYFDKIVIDNLSSIKKQKNKT